MWDRLHQAAGLRVLQGVLLGLYRVREGERVGELLAGAPDFPDETAAWVWQMWRRASRGRAPLPEAFVRDHLAEWTWLLPRRARR